MATHLNLTNWWKKKPEFIGICVKYFNKNLLALLFKKSKKWQMKIKYACIYAIQIILMSVKYIDMHGGKHIVKASLAPCVHRSLT